MLCRSLYRGARRAQCNLLIAEVDSPEEPIATDGLAFRHSPSLCGLSVQTFGLGQTSSVGTQHELECRAAHPFREKGLDKQIS